jgi:hypothetical protein
MFRRHLSSEEPRPQENPSIIGIASWISEPPVRFQLGLMAILLILSGKNRYVSVSMNGAFVITLDDIYYLESLYVLEDILPSVLVSQSLPNIQ